MSNTQNLIQALGYSTNADTLNTYLLKNTYSKNTNNLCFSYILAQLNRNLESSQISSSMNSFGYSSSTSTFLNQTTVAPNISAIAQKIKDEDNGIYSLDQQVAQYLLDNYGGDKASVIMTLSGVQSLPLQMTALQNPVFQTIVSKISTQVRNYIYSGQDFDSSSDDSSSYEVSVDSSVSDSSSSDVADI
jgi:hypothetical protein